MSGLIDTVRAGASKDELLAQPLPESFRAAHLRSVDVNIFRDNSEKDVRRSIHVGEVPFPQIEHDEVIVAVMASSINFNTVWSALFEPIQTFSFLKQFAQQSPSGARHNLPYHILGSDAAGVVVRVGAGVRRCAVGDHVVVHAAYIDPEDHVSQHDGMVSDSLRAWGYETNFGGLADFTVVKANQILPKAPHLTWEEAACIPLCGSTAYRMLVSSRGARMKQGDIVLIWGATGGLGSFAIQLVKNGGGIPVGIVSSTAKPELALAAGCQAVINRSELNWSLENGQLSKRAWRILRKKIRNLIDEDPHIVFEYIGRETFGTSVYLAQRGGTVVTCGSSSGYDHEYDNRYLWTNLKKIIGSHGANYHEAWELNRLVRLGVIVPTLSITYPLTEVEAATRSVQINQHVGKVAVRCLAQTDGLGIVDPEFRERVGERRLNLFRTAVTEATVPVAR